MPHPDTTKPAICGLCLVWYRQQESNLYLPLRRGPLYPFNYGGEEARIVPPVPDLPKCCVACVAPDCCARCFRKMPEEPCRVALCRMPC